MSSGKHLNTERTNRIPRGLKAERKHHIITHNPSSANANETLYIRIPRLTENTFFVPGTVYLSADIIISGNEDNTVSNNLSRNIISMLVVKWGAESILCIDNYNLFATFKDLWLTKEERNDGVFCGIQSENLRKLRSGITVAGASDTEKALYKVFAKKLMIPLDFDLLSTVRPFYKFLIQEDVIFDVTLAPKESVIVTGTPAKMKYKLENICLEYNTITHEPLASQLKDKYNTGFSLYYDWIDLFKIVTIAKNDTLINENINLPRRSIKGILLLFVSDYDAGKRDSEKFENPDITTLKITIEGVSNKVFAEGMRQLDQWPEVKKHFMREDIKRSHDCFMTMEKYYADDKYGLWLDLRTTEDNVLHGSGKMLQNTKDSIQITFKKDDSKGPYKMYIFLVADAQFNVVNSQLSSITY